ncbi:MAG: hypothetical protein HC896_04280 [Bacteroidales bacterium]|nr:hypothetical protein [Bacteroidales bacterium]
MNRHKKGLFALILLAAHWFMALPAPPPKALEAYAAFEKKQYQKAVSLFGELTQEDNNAQHFLYLGHAHYYAQQLNKAKATYLAVNNQKPGMASFYLAKCYALEKKYDSAYFYLEENLKSKYKTGQTTILLDPAFVKINETNAWNHFWSNDWYTKHEVAQAEADYHINQGEFREALALLEKSSGKKKRHYILACQAKAYEGLMAYKKAESLISQAIDIKKNEPAYFKNKGRNIQQTRKLQKSCIRHKCHLRT